MAKVWAGDLERVYFEDAVEALTMHYRESTDWAMPRHIIANSRRVNDAREREQRKLRALPAPNVITLPENFAEMSRAALEAHRAGRS